MSVLRLASKESKRISIGDGDDYLEVRQDISKRDFAKLIKILPSNLDAEKGMTLDDADNFSAGLFDLLVVGWSLKDDAGNPIIPTVEVYYSLSRDAAIAVDTVLVEHFNSLTPTDDDRRKSEGTGE